MDYKNLTKEQIIDGIINTYLKFENLSEDLKDNKDIALTAINKDGFNIQYVSERLKDDRDVVSESIKRSPNALTFASKRLQDDRGIVLEAIKQNGWALQFASERLKNEKGLVLISVRSNGNCLQYTSEKFQNDKDCLEVLEKGYVFEWYLNNKSWYEERMKVLASIREKEFIESSFIPSEKKVKKIKF